MDGWREDQPNSNRGKQRIMDERSAVSIGSMELAGGRGGASLKVSCSIVSQNPYLFP